MRNRILFHGILIVLVLLFLPGFVFPAATLTIKSINKKVTVPYDDDAPVEVSETITVRHKGDATDFFLTFSAGQSGNFDTRTMSDTQTADQMSYQLYKGAGQQNVLKDLTAAATSDEVITGYFPVSSKWQTISFTYVFYIPANQFVAKGDYEDTVLITLYEGTLSSWFEQDSSSVSFTSQMDEIAELSLIPTGQAFDPLQTKALFNFGILEAGEELSADIIIRSNAVFSLSLQSDNQGVMANIDRSDKSEVPYRFTFNGTAITLSGNRPVEVPADQGPTDGTGYRYPFSVTILPYGMATEGTYEDTIAVTISTK